MYKKMYTWYLTRIAKKIKGVLDSTYVQHSLLGSDLSSTHERDYKQFSHKHFMKLPMWLLNSYVATHQYRPLRTSNPTSERVRL